MPTSNEQQAVQNEQLAQQDVQNTPAERLAKLSEEIAELNKKHELVKDLQLSATASVETEKLAAGVYKAAKSEKEAKLNEMKNSKISVSEYPSQLKACEALDKEIKSLKNPSSDYSFLHALTAAEKSLSVLKSSYDKLAKIDAEKEQANITRTAYKKILGENSNPDTVKANAAAEYNKANDNFTKLFKEHYDLTSGELIDNSFALLEKVKAVKNRLETVNEQQDKALSSTNVPINMIIFKADEPQEKISVKEQDNKYKTTLALLAGKYPFIRDYAAAVNKENKIYNINLAQIVKSDLPEVEKKHADKLNSLKNDFLKSFKNNHINIYVDPQDVIGSVGKEDADIPYAVNGRFNIPGKNDLKYSFNGNHCFAFDKELGFVGLYKGQSTSHTALKKFAKENLNAVAPTCDLVYSDKSADVMKSTYDKVLNAMPNIAELQDKFKEYSVKKLPKEVSSFCKLIKQYKDVDENGKISMKTVCNNTDNFIKMCDLMRSNGFRNYLAIESQEQKNPEFSTLLSNTQTYFTNFAKAAAVCQNISDTLIKDPNAVITSKAAAVDGFLDLCAHAFDPKLQSTCIQTEETVQTQPAKAVAEQKDITNQNSPSITPAVASAEQRSAPVQPKQAAQPEQTAQPVSLTVSELAAQNNKPASVPVQSEQPKQESVKSQDVKKKTLIK